MAQKKIAEIKNWYTGAVIATGDPGETLADLVARKVAERANLGSADLRFANLGSANLGFANLRFANLGSADLGFADLGSADLRFANLGSANLGSANLRFANLGSANLGSANLGFANLGSANLGSANLGSANLPSPTAVLLATWGDLSAQLVADLMLYDSTCHPDPEAFQRWANGGACPYDAARVQRAAHFKEDATLWGRGMPCRPYDLMVRVLAEACPAWTEEQVKAFEENLKK